MYKLIKDIKRFNKAQLIVLLTFQKLKVQLNFKTYLLK